MSVATSGDDRQANLIAAGGLYWLLWAVRYPQGPLTAVEVVTKDGIATNQIDFGLAFLASRYRITIERVPGRPGMCSCWHHVGRLSCPVHPRAEGPLSDATDIPEPQ